MLYIIYLKVNIIFKPFIHYYSFIPLKQIPKSIFKNQNYKYIISQLIFIIFNKLKIIIIFKYMLYFHQLIIKFIL